MLKIVDCITTCLHYYLFTTAIIGQSRRGVEGSVLFSDGYRYNREIGKSNKTYWRHKIWRCVKRNYGCRARVCTIDQVIVKRTNDHNHGRNYNV